MNTPTPAQALGDLEEVARDRFRNGDQYSAAILRRCGQHFAGLEKEAAELREFKRYADEANENLKIMCLGAEARCVELMEQRDSLTACCCGCSRKSCPECGEEILGPLSWVDPNDQTVAALLAASGESKVTTHPEQAARDMLERMGFEDAQGMTAGDVGALANLIANSRIYEARLMAACAMAWRICNFSDSEMRDGDAAREECAAFLAANGEL